jgi:hypothetical protein
LDQMQEHLLAKAREADEQAAKCSDPNLREAWLRIAEGFRKLMQPRLPKD